MYKDLYIYNETIFFTDSLQVSSFAGICGSIFYSGYSARESTDKENSTTAVTKVATSDTDGKYLVPRTAFFRAIDNQQEAVKSVQSVTMARKQVTLSNPLLDKPRVEEDSISPLVQIATEQQVVDDELKSLNKAENISNITEVVDIESHFTSDDQLLTFSVTQDSQIHFQTVDDVCTVTVLNSWSIVESSTEHKLLMLFQIVSNAAKNGDIAVIRKGIVIDDKRRIKYAVHGKIIKHDVPQLPQELTDPRILPNILNHEFHILHVCDGLGDANINLAESGAVYKDSMNMNRSMKCMLIGRKKTCNFCARLRKTLRQKHFRYAQRGQLKRIVALSNPVDQRKFNVMRLKINRERRAKVVERDG